MHALFPRLKLSLRQVQKGYGNPQNAYSFSNIPKKGIEIHTLALESPQGSKPLWVSRPHGAVLGCSRCHVK